MALRMNVVHAKADRLTRAAPGTRSIASWKPLKVSAWGGTALPSDYRRGTSTASGRVSIPVRVQNTVSLSKAGQPGW